ATAAVSARRNFCGAAGVGLPAGSVAAVAAFFGAAVTAPWALFAAAAVAVPEHRLASGEHFGRAPAGAGVLRYASAAGPGSALRTQPDSVGAPAFGVCGGSAGVALPAHLALAGSEFVVGFCRKRWPTTGAQ